MMPIDPHDALRSRGNWTRREALGLAAASLAIAGCKTAARGGSQGSSATRLANRTGVLEASGASPQLASLKNNQGGFEWLAGVQLLSPLFETGTERPAAWTPLPAEAKTGTLAIRTSAAGGVQAELEIGAFDDTGAFSWQQAFRNAGNAPIASIGAISALDLFLRGDLGELLVHCVRRDSDYSREALPFRDRLEVRGGGWNAPSHAGLLIIEATEKSEFLVIGVQHERGWTFSLEREQDRIRLRVAVSEMEASIAPGQRFEAPPLYVGVCGGSLDEAVNLSLSHLRARILPKSLEGQPWVSYDIWSTDGANVEQNVHDEIAFAASLGFELFYLDASWYRNSSRKGLGDWGKGIGSYEEDRVKFPRGLRYLSDQVHAAGMKFGLWVGPNIVDEDLIPRVVPEKWLAMVDGKRAELNIPNWENTVVQVCLGSPEYTEHLKKELTRLVGEYNLDWIKWDNSGIPALPARCNRADHGHAPGDGSAAALANEYVIFKHLHEKFPQLSLEQCGYGSRLDLGRAAWVRANWCSDTTYPSERVRSNALACATVFPSGGNAAWIVREDKEFFGYDKSHQIDAGIRSRMVGLFGVGTLNGQMSQRASLYPRPVIDRLKANIVTYKQFRHLLMKQVSYPFQPYGRSPNGWEAVQFTDDGAGEAVVLCFRGASSQSTSLVKLGRLGPDTRYRVRRSDADTEEQLTGRELMTRGLVVELSQSGSSEVLLLKAVQR